MEQTAVSLDNLQNQPLLPDPFLRPDGKSRISTPDQWEEQRAYWKELLAQYLYGHMPPHPAQQTRGELLSTQPIYGDRALRDHVRITCGRQGKVSFEILVIRPNKPGRFPVITWNCFRDMRPCPIEEEAVCSRNYCIAMFQKEQLAADDASARSPIFELYADYDWKTIAVWAWGHSRIADYLEQTDYADLSKLIATGHSRGGKTALCAAIYDTRFAMAAVNGSGCGGAGCFRFLGGRGGLSQDPSITESLGRITTAFPHWFSDRICPFGTQTPPYGTCAESYLPFDLHIAKALVAPRPLVTMEGLGDQWANTYGTQITWRAAREVYRFLGAEDRIAVHYREGGHQFGPIDWTVLLDFADATLRKDPKPFTYPVNNLPFDNAPLHFDWAAPERT